MTTKEDFAWCNELSRDFLSKDYLVNGDTPESRLWDIAMTAEKNLGIKGFAKKFYGYIARGFYSFSTPVWTNYGNKRGLPVSCFGTYIEDTTASIMEGVYENGMLMKNGGGTSAYFGALRPRGAKISTGGESYGSFHFFELYDKLRNTISQNSVRRGFLTPYQDIEHPDVDDFLKIGDEGNPVQGMTFAVCVPDAFMERVKDREPVALEKWARVLDSIKRKGYPYIFFVDTVNRMKPDCYKKHNLWISASNMCIEIALPSTGTETFTCVLSSINLVHWDEIKETDAIECMIYFLDTVVTEFVDRTEGLPYMARARRFAERHRALGMGVLGFHSMLQSKSIPVESVEASTLNLEIFKTIQEKAEHATRELAALFGEPELLIGTGRRNTTLTAIAPTKSSSFIHGQVSQGIDMEMSNYYVRDTAKGKWTIKNPYLVEVLEARGENTRETWRSIMQTDGSVQHLDFLSDHEKDVFKTFEEIDPYKIVDLAAIRQKYICQGQSLNVRLPSNWTGKDINAFYTYGWEMGLKSFYYAYASSKAQQLSRKKIAECASCEA